MSKLALAAFLLTMLVPAIGRAGCSNLSLGNVAVKNMTSDGGNNHYQIQGVVTNDGASQSSSALQAVDIYKGPVKLDSKSIPQLKAGQAFTFSYISVRSSDAGSGTTHLRFVLVSKNGALCGDMGTRAIVTF